MDPKTGAEEGRDQGRRGGRARPVRQPRRHPPLAGGVPVRSRLPVPGRSPAASWCRAIIVSPAHAKRFVEALQANIKRYEDAYGDDRARRTCRPRSTSSNDAALPPVAVLTSGGNFILVEPDRQEYYHLTGLFNARQRSIGNRHREEV
ncbi:MAG: DUF3467 domain-containing protein [Ignavibacteriales bacterium]|nr:DUF3467 domain-containing protein [Ignavibacteriales bacterium]